MDNFSGITHFRTFWIGLKIMDGFVSLHIRNNFEIETLINVFTQYFMTFQKLQYHTITRFVVE